MPQGHVRWLVEQPDDVLSQSMFFTEKLQYMLVDIIRSFDCHKIAFNLLVRNFSRNVQNTQADMFDEMRHMIDTTLGLDTAWKEINLYQAVQTILGGSIRRVLVGQPLCYDEKYLHATKVWSAANGACVLISDKMADFMRPAVGILFRYPMYMYQRRIVKILSTVVEERMRKIKQKQTDPSFIYDEPKDLLQCMTASLMNPKNTSHTPPEVIATHFNHIVGPS